MIQQTGGTPPSMPNQGENSSQENSQNNESNQQIPQDKINKTTVNLVK